ncbi:MAG TPA: TlpA disulfide reductase family protein [Propionibacteriaceae bacterium]|nr:TlpA disulfide reductase family protein [Propionibacteriaceae bacterium]
MTRAWLLVVAAALLTGCTETPDLGERQETNPSRPSQSRPAAPSAAELAAQKKAAGIADCPTSDPQSPALEGGLPDVVLSCLGGGRDVRLAGLRGKPTLINVWAQWCGPCRKEAPYLTEVASQDQSQLQILGVDYVDPQPGLALEFAQRSRWRYPQLADPDKALGAPLQIAGPPQTLFVRADGTLAYRHSGPFTSATQIRRLATEHLGIRW